ncbi:MAG: NAD(P)H-dependent oxidoreductase subunit E [bacterium]
MKNQLLQKEIDKARAVLSKSSVDYIELCNKKKNPNSYLISVLHKVQGEYGYLGKEQMDAVSVLMQVPAAKVTGVASFYHFFTFTPRGKHRISLCMGTACFVKGAGKVLEKIQELLDTKVGETSADGLFSIDVARCVGACALAPVMLVDDKVYAQVKPAQVDKILAEYGFVPKKAKK